MSDQDFRERVLSAIDDLKRTIDRMDDRIDRRLTTIEVDGRNLRDEIGELRSDVRDETDELRGDVRWIRGKFEGRQEATSNTDAKTAIWIALGSALAAIISLIKSFWA